MAHLQVSGLLSISEEDIETHELLGTGSSGVVFKGIWKSKGEEIDVAIKKMKINTLEEKEQMLQELKLAQSIHFEHICEVYGGCLANKGTEIWMVMEYVDGGDLHNFLTKHDGPLPLPLQLSLCIQAAKALSFLHSLSSPVLHRDVKSLNFLVRKGTHLLLTDFGLSKASSLISSSTFTMGTVRWAAPEIVTQRPQWTDKADVYSLGLVFYEIVTKTVPYHDDRNLASVLKKIQSGTHPKLPDSPKELRALIKHCLNLKPSKRPSANELVAYLEKLQETINKDAIDNVVHVDEKPKVMAATLDELIELLAGVAPDIDIMPQFLRTHHRFVNSTEFLQKLIDRYNSPDNGCISQEEYVKIQKIVQGRTLHLIKRWIELQTSDFQTNHALFLMLQSFLNSLLKAGGMQAILASNLQIAILHSEAKQTDTSVLTSVSEERRTPKPIVPKNTIARLMQFLDVNPLEMARQITLLDSEAICKVQLSEYDHKKWNGENTETLGPNLLSIIDRFDKTRFWLASEILKQTDLRLRVKVLSYCIKLMQHLMQMGNMQGMMAVYSAVEVTPIQQLGKTWNNLKTKYSVILKSIGNLMNPSQNYKTYREHVRTAVLPFIPYQRICLADLTFLEEEAPNILDNGAINIRKMRLIGTLLNDIHTFQSVTHKFIAVPSIQEFIMLRVSSAVDEEQLYAMSKLIEPQKEL